MKVEDIKHSTKPTMFMPIGVSGSGKSTVLKQIQTVIPDILVFSLDRLRHEWYDVNDYANAYKLACADDRFMGRAQAYFFELIKQGKDIYMDNTNLGKKRTSFVKAAVRHGLHTVAITFNVDLATVIARQKTRPDKEVPEAAVRQQWAGLQLPHPGEFDEIMSNEDFQNRDGNGISSSKPDTSSLDQLVMSSTPEYNLSKAS